MDTRAERKFSVCMEIITAFLQFLSSIFDSLLLLIYFCQSVSVKVKNSFLGLGVINFNDYF